MGREKMADAKTKGDHVKTFHRCTEFPEPVQGQVADLLAHGASAEGAAAVVNESPHYQITSKAVINFYRTHPELHARRAQYFTERTEAIFALLGKGNVSAGEKRYAGAVIMDGLLAEMHKDRLMSVRDAMSKRAELENLKLKNKILQFRRQAALEEKEERAERTRLLRRRAEFISTQSNKLARLGRKLDDPENLTPDALQKIRSIYGLIAEGVATVSGNPPADMPPLPPPEPPTEVELENEIYRTNPQDPEGERKIRALNEELARR